MASIAAAMLLLAPLATDPGWTRVAMTEGAHQRVRLRSEDRTVRVLA